MIDLFIGGDEDMVAPLAEAKSGRILAHPILAHDEESR